MHAKFRSAGENISSIPIKKKFRWKIFKKWVQCRIRFWAVPIFPNFDYGHPVRTRIFLKKCFQLCGDCADRYSSISTAMAYFLARLENIARPKNNSRVCLVEQYPWQYLGTWVCMVQCVGTRCVLDLWRHFPPPKSMRVHAPQAAGKYLWWSMTSRELTLHRPTREFRETIDG